MKINYKIITTLTFCSLFLPVSQGYATEEFRAVGKIMESKSNHTTDHNHKLKLLRISDGEVFDIVDSPEFVKVHCESEKNSVFEVEGYRTGKFLFWGGNVVVKNFKVHEDIEVSKRAHLSPEGAEPKTGFEHSNPRL